MRVIGTAGHVDHGKTALIRSLTGMDADRLPEERARGMTTDLGFAWYEGGGGEAIGVVDVPGHERYLRNMVAGAWGLDLVILVVAADDGWMPQTTLHASIVASLSAPAVVLAITKTDAVTHDRTAAVTADALGRAAALFGARPEAVAVSNLSGSGIAELKAAIDRSLGQRPAASGGSPRLYVDRVFAPLGGGLVVTGTLRGGSVAVGTELELYPVGVRVRVRGVQSYRAELGVAEPACRAALSLSGAREGIRRGNLLAAPGAPVLAGTEFLGRLLPLPGTPEIGLADARGRPLLRDGMEAELAVGTARSDVEVWRYRGSDCLRIVSSEPVACPAGAAFVLLRRGGAAMLCRGSLVRADSTKPEDRKALASVLPRVAAAAAMLESAGWGLEDASAYRLSLATFRSGWTIDRSGLTAAEARAAGFECAKAQDGALVTFDPVRWTLLRQAFLSAAGEPAGLSIAAAWSLFAKTFAQGDAGGDASTGEAIGAALASLIAEKSIRPEGALWKASSPVRSLSPEESALLARLKAAGKAGLEPGKTTAQSDARSLKTLCSFGEARPLDGGIFMARDAFDACVEAILRGRTGGDSITVGDAKERSGLSRKYILPLLNRMEDARLVKRSGDERIVL